jgi:hypothetical protein
MAMRIEAKARLEAPEWFMSTGREGSDNRNLLRAPGSWLVTIMVRLPKIM